MQSMVSQNKCLFCVKNTTGHVCNIFYTCNDLNTKLRIYELSADLVIKKGKEPHTLSSDEDILKTRAFYKNSLLDIMT